MRLRLSSLWWLRVALARSAVAWWVATALLALTTALVVGRLVGGAAAELDRLGRRRAVPVVVRPVAAGEVVGADAVEQREVPVAFLPGAAVAVDPVGRRAVVPLFRGEVVVAAKLASGRVSPVAARVPRGRRAVAVPRAVATPRVHPGDVVDVLATFGDGVGAGDGGGAPPTVVVARGALVVDGDGESVTVAVGQDEAVRIAFAVSVGNVTLALAPPVG